MKVKEIMHGITMINSNMSVLEAARIMSNKDIGSVLIKKDDRVGILTERDILKKVVARNRSPDIKVSEVMTNNTFTIDSEANIEEASELFNKHNIRRLVVTERGNIVGIVTTRDVAKSLPYIYLKRRKEYTGSI